jgi:ornithine carbamoyltransferase
LALALVERLGRGAGVPVFDGLASPRHPSAALAPLLDPSDSVERRRLLVLQAMLLFSLR